MATIGGVLIILAIVGAAVGLGLLADWFIMNYRPNDKDFKGGGKPGI